MSCRLSVSGVCHMLIWIFQFGKQLGDIGACIEYLAPIVGN